ncbi:uncharacterized protein K460DRAFT_209440 [Cucurbitaria berberidis CBS 394.84]|uniref:Uncharacterized protein n=1 Tax=Cucurbitaria berberidis CBS 394.84 TaxID=1168544 RepID=A0A9P4L3N2_9PLEO|nr:uncharacterized protein K460DRAFT_209440 [Cucurbitaria berberidis CBS 394.84]KAF1840499.1 hypothetical protein K460DRAFT_209440 [Cucurbitaria berberidis CBS 394.84]
MAAAFGLLLARRDWFHDAFCHVVIFFLAYLISCGFDGLISELARDIWDSIYFVYTAERSERSPFFNWGHISTLRVMKRTSADWTLFCYSRDELPFFLPQQRPHFYLLHNTPAGPNVPVSLRYHTCLEILFLEAFLLRLHNSCFMSGCLLVGFGAGKDCT